MSRILINSMFLKLLFVLFFIEIVFLWICIDSVEAKRRWGEDYFPNVTLITDTGKKVKFYDDLIKDKVVAINFIFTSCRFTCPMETARLREVQEKLGDRVGDDIFFYSISIDPKRDTPEVLRAYKEKFKVAPGWTFLTGEEEDITLLRKKLGLYIEEIQDDSNDHNLNLVIGNQATGHWLKRSPFENPNLLARLLANNLHQWKRSKKRRNNFADAPLKLKDMSKGKYLYQTRCKTCHTIGGGDSVGPDLIGVTLNRDSKWLRRWLFEPDKMLEEKDPQAMALYIKYQKLAMPNLQLNDIDIDALISFMKEIDLDIRVVRPPLAY